VLQGFLFAKPSSAGQFTRTCWSAARHWQPSSRSHTHLCSKRSL
jgi:hypothetical protein